MPLRTVYEIDINDAAWQKFAQQYREYQSLLEKSPAEWRKVSDAIGNTSTTTKDMAAGTLGVAESMRGIADESHRAAKGGESFGHLLSGQANLWRGMAHDAKSFTTSITEATRQLLRWGALTGLISGILGGGGLFGIDRLASSAGSQRRSSLGLGVTPGEQSAFTVDYGRVVDPNQFLGGINEALHDRTKRVLLTGAGLSEADVRGKDTAQVADLAIQSIKKMVDKWDPNNLGAFLKTHHLESIMSLQDVERLRNTPAGEIAGYSKDFNADQKKLDFDRQTAKAWQDLQVQMKRAGSEIETVFIKGLVPLAPEIEGLSKSFVHLVQDFMGSNLIKDAIGEVAKGLDWLDQELKSPDFQKGVQSFLQEVEDLAKSKGMQDFVTDAEKLAKSLGDALPSFMAFTGYIQTAWDVTKTIAHTADATGQAIGHSARGAVDQLAPTSQSQADQSMDDAKAGEIRLMQKFHNWLYGNVGGGASVQNQSYEGSPIGSGGAKLIQAAYTTTMPSASMRGNVATVHDFFRGQGYTEAQTAGFLANVQGESNFNPGAINPTSGAQGLFQWLGPRLQRYRQMFGHDPSQGTVQEQLTFAQWELTHTETATADALKKYGGDNAGVSGVIINDSFERNGQSGIKRGVNAEAYQSQYGGQFKDRSVQVNINNNTGGNAVVTANQISV